MQIIFSPTDYLEFEEAPKAKSRQTISSCWQPVAMQSLQLVIDYRTCVTSSARSLLNTERYRFFLRLASCFKKSHNAVLYFTKCWYFLQVIRVHKSIRWLGPSILSAKTQISWAGRIKWGVWTWWKNIPVLIFFLVFNRRSLQLQRDVFIEISILYSGFHPSIAATVQFF